MPSAVTILLFNYRTYRSKLVSHLLWSLLILGQTLSFLHFKFEKKYFFSFGRVYLQSVSIKMSSQHAPHFYWGYDGKLSGTAGCGVTFSTKTKEMPFLSVFQILAFTLASTASTSIYITTPQSPFPFGKFSLWNFHIARLSGPFSLSVNTLSSIPIPNETAY